MLRIRNAISLLGLGVCIAGSAAAATVVVSFEAGEYGTSTSNEPLVTASTHVVSVETSGTGATDGSRSLKMQIPSGATTGSNMAFSGTTIAARAAKAGAIFGNQTIMVDVTRPVATGAFTQLWLAFNYNTGGSSGPFGNTSISAPSPFAVPALVSFGNTETGTKTLTWNVPFVNPRSDAGYWCQMYFKTNTGASGADTIYIDNIRVANPIPEPASLGLLSLGGVALLRRRANA
jgi:hypothetical protein